MANVFLLFIFAYLKYVSAYSIHINLPKINLTDANITSHFQYAHIRRICSNRSVICKSNNTVICAVRRVDDDFEYRNFENSCFLLLSNMCDNPGKEFSIAESVPCADFLKTRRMYVYSGVEVDPTTAKTTKAAPQNSTKNAMLRDLQASPSKFSPLYDIETAFDYHNCPLRCPDVYSPVCVSANRGLGKYFKFWMFANHCAGDLYYCQHWQDFSAPEGEDENVISSALGWSFCGAHRYLQLARFTEVASSMGHYGWLQGDYQYSHIMEGHERKPGFG